MSFFATARRCACVRPGRTTLARYSTSSAAFRRRASTDGFHGFPELGPRLVEPLTTADAQEAGALVGCIDNRIVAVANFARLRDPKAAEVAFAVADDYQRQRDRHTAARAARGPRRRARRRALRRGGASGQPADARRLRGRRLRRHARRGGGEVELTFPIAPTEHYLESVESRDHEAVVASLRPFFEPVVRRRVGASPRRGSIGGELFRNVLAADFTGAAYPVNRQGESVAGVRGYGTIAEIPEPVDLAVICVPGRARARRGRGRARQGVRALCVISRGSRRSARRVSSARIAARARARARRADDRPELPRDRLAGTRLNATFAGKAPRWGSIGFSSQSGALGLALIEAADARGIGLSAFVSIGNKADVSSNDLLERFEDDEATNLVALYLESFGNPRQVRAHRATGLALEADPRAQERAHVRRREGGRLAHRGADELRRSSRRALPPGRRDPGGDARGARRRSRCCSRAQSLPLGRRVAVLTNAGGLGILAADACEAAGLELPTLAEETRPRSPRPCRAEASVANPVDMLGSATAATYEAVLPMLLADRGVDAVLVLFVPPVTATADEVGARGRAGAAGADKPVLARAGRAAGSRRARSRRRGVVRVSRVGCARSAGRPRGPSGCAGRPAAPGRSRASTATLRADRDGRARTAPDVWLDPEDPRAARGLRHPGRRGASRWRRPRSRARSRRARLPVVVKTAARGCAQDRDRRSRARPRRRGRRPRGRRADRSAGPRPADGGAAAPSCSPGSCRTSCSGRSSRSGRAACWPS